MEMAAPANEQEDRKPEAIEPNESNGGAHNADHESGAKGNSHRLKVPRTAGTAQGDNAIAFANRVVNVRSNAVLSGRWPAAVGLIEACPQRSAWTHS
jgi:hypothetical protein